MAARMAGIGRGEMDSDREPEVTGVCRAAAERRLLVEAAGDRL